VVPLSELPVTEVVLGGILPCLTGCSSLADGWSARACWAVRF